MKLRAVAAQETHVAAELIDAAFNEIREGGVHRLRVTAEDVAESQLPQLAFVTLEHRAHRGVQLEGTSVGAEQDDADRRALEDGVEPRLVGRGG